MTATTLDLEHLLGDASALARTLVASAVPDDSPYTVATGNVYDPPQGRALLEAVHPLLESAVGASLRPTHTFARIYGPGAVLKAHTDREPLHWTVSVDLTDSRWPLEVTAPDGWKALSGRAVAVAGGTVLHRRATPYAGSAPAVVLLLHYECVRTPPRIAAGAPQHVVAQVLERADLERLYEQLDEGMLQPGMVSVEGVPAEIRACSVMWLQGSAWQWLEDIVRQAAAQVNERAWRCPLAADGVERLQFTRYQVGEHYGWHRDRDEAAAGPTARRALSVVCCLRNPAAGDGLELRDVGVIPLAEGAAAIFSAETEHRALPVTEGARDSLVLWLAEA